jgi:hypothetical protein
LQKFHALETMWGGNNVQQQQNNKKAFESKVLTCLACLPNSLAHSAFLIVGKKTSKDLKRSIETWDWLRRLWSQAKDCQWSRVFQILHLGIWPKVLILRGFQVQQPGFWPNIVTSIKSIHVDECVHIVDMEDDKMKRSNMETLNNFHCKCDANIPQQEAF